MSQNTPALVRHARALNVKQNVTYASLSTGGLAILIVTATLGVLPVLLVPLFPVSIVLMLAFAIRAFILFARKGMTAYAREDALQASKALMHFPRQADHEFNMLGLRKSGTWANIEHLLAGGMLYPENELNRVFETLRRVHAGVYSQHHRLSTELREVRNEHEASQLSVAFREVRRRAERIQTLYDEIMLAHSVQQKLSWGSFKKLTDNGGMRPIIWEFGSAKKLLNYLKGEKSISNADYRRLNEQLKRLEPLLLGILVKKADRRDAYYSFGLIELELDIVASDYQLRCVGRSRLS